MSIVGKPVIVLPYKCRGCLDRITGFLTTWLVRLLFALGFFLMGYGCAVMRQ